MATFCLRASAAWNCSTPLSKKGDLAEKTERSLLHSRLVYLNLDAQILSHYLFEMVARLLKNFQPAVLPIAYAGKPGRTSTTRETFGAAAVEVHLAIPIEHLAAPDFLDGDFVRVRKEFRRPERNVLTAERNAAERIHIEAFEGPDARLFLLRRQIGVEMLIESLAGRNGGVVVPGKELPRNHLVDADF